MKILITGGAGYIGSKLVYDLAQNKEVSEIVIYDNLSRNNYNLFISEFQKIDSVKVSFILGDILDGRLLRKSLTDIEVVYHLAAKVASPFESADSHSFEQVNHWGASELVSAIEESESVKQLIYVSSTGVYGTTNTDTEADEETIPNPSTFYAISKYRSEPHILRLSKKIKTVIYRAGNVYGFSPAVKFNSVINKFMFDSQFINRININGSGKQSRPFIHIDKLSSILAQTICSDIQSGTYNMADKNISILDLVDVFKEIYTELEFIFINQHLELRSLNVADNKKLKQHFNLPETDLKEELLQFKENNFSF